MSSVFFLDFGAHIPAFLLPAFRHGKAVGAGRGPPWVEPQEEQKARPPHGTFPAWMELAGAEQGPAQGQETLTSKKVSFC